MALADIRGGLHMIWFDLQAMVVGIDRFSKLTIFFVGVRQSERSVDILGVELKRSLITPGGGGKILVSLERSAAIVLVPCQLMIVEGRQWKIGEGACLFFF